MEKQFRGERESKCKSYKLCKMKVVRTEWANEVCDWNDQVDIFGNLGVARIVTPVVPTTAQAGSEEWVLSTPACCLPDFSDIHSNRFS